MKNYYANRNGFNCLDRGWFDCRFSGRIGHESWLAVEEETKEEKKVSKD